MKAPVIFLILFSIFFKPEFQTTDTFEKDKELSELHNLMQGSFNSELQSQQDSSYYNISLHMYPIWTDKGYFLYVEQALNSMKDQPYRQRVYEITRLTDSTFSSAVFTLPNEKEWVGRWKTPKSFDQISKSDLMLRDGCEVILKRLDNKHFKGSTSEFSCNSSLRGASYATSEVEITKGTIISWDRGMDKNGNQFWGAEKGGYIFNKIN